MSVYQSNGTSPTYPIQFSSYDIITSPTSANQGVTVSQSGSNGGYPFAFSNGHGVSSNTSSATPVQSVSNQYTASSTPIQYISSSTPNQYTTSSTPNQYTTSSTPNQYTTSSTPIQYTSSSSPIQYTTSSAPIHYTTSSAPIEYRTSQISTQPFQSVPIEYTTGHTSTLKPPVETFEQRDSAKEITVLRGKEVLVSREVMLSFKLNELQDQYCNLAAAYEQQSVANTTLLNDLEIWKSRALLAESQSNVTIVNKNEGEVIAMRREIEQFKVMVSKRNEDTLTIESLNTINFTLQQEIEQWKSKYLDLEHSFVKKLEEVRQSWIVSYHAEYDAEWKLIISKLEAEKRSLEITLSKIRDEYEAKLVLVTVELNRFKEMGSSTDLRRTISILEQDKRNLEMKIQSMSGASADLESKLSSMSLQINKIKQEYEQRLGRANTELNRLMQENDQLAATVNQKTREHEQIKRSAAVTAANTANAANSNKEKELRDRIQVLEQSIAANSANNSKEKELRDRIQVLEQVIPEKEKETAFWKDQVQILQNKSKQVEGDKEQVSYWKERYGTLETSIDLKIKQAVETTKSNYERQVVQLQSQIANLQVQLKKVSEYEELITKLRADIAQSEMRVDQIRKERPKDNLEYLVADLEDKIAEMEEKMIVLLNENNRLSLDLEQYIQRCNKLEKFENEIMIYKKRYDELELSVNSETENLRQQIIGLQTENQKFYNIQIEYEQRINSLLEKQRNFSSSSDAESWRIRYNDMEKNYQSQLAQLRSNYDILMKKTKESDFSTSGGNDLKLKLQLKDREIQEIHDQYEAKLIELNGRLELYAKKDKDGGDLKLKLQQKDRDIVDLQTRYESQITQLNKDSEGIISSLRQKLKNKEAELDELNAHLENKTREHEHVKSSVMKSSEKLKVDLETKNKQELENYKKGAQAQFDEMIAKYEEEIRNYQILIKKLKSDVVELELEVKNLLQENAKLTDTSLARWKELEGLRAKLETATRASMTSSEEKNLRNLKNSQTDFNELKIKMETDKQSYELKISHLQKLLANKDQEVQELSDLIDQVKEETVQWQRKFEEIQTSTSNSSSEYKVLKEQYATMANQVQEATKSRELYKIELEKLYKKYQEAMGYQGATNGQVETVSKSYVTRSQYA